MKWIFRLERKLGRRFGIYNLMLYVTAPMFAVYILWIVGFRGLPGYFRFDLGMVLSGEVWRVVTFLVMPPLSANVLLAIIGMYAAYHIGTSLEREWGKTLFTMYFFLGAIGALIAGIISSSGTNHYLILSIILAYMYIYPDATFMLFLILPVKAKYLAIVTWGIYIYQFIMSNNLAVRLAIVLSLINFFLFFGPGIINTMKKNYRSGKRHRQFRKNWEDNWR